MSILLDLHEDEDYGTPNEGLYFEVNGGGSEATSPLGLVIDYRNDVHLGYFKIDSGMNEEHKAWIVSNDDVFVAVID